MKLSLVKSGPQFETTFFQPSLTFNWSLNCWSMNSTWEFLIHLVWTGAWEFAFLAGLQVMLIQLVVDNSVQTKASHHFVADTAPDTFLLWKHYTQALATQISKEQTSTSTLWNTVNIYILCASPQPGPLLTRLTHFYPIVFLNANSKTKKKKPHCSSSLISISCTSDLHFYKYIIELVHRTRTCNSWVRPTSKGYQLSCNPNEMVGNFQEA